MAVKFGAVSSDRWEYGSPSHLDDLPSNADGFSVLSWVFRTANGTNQHIVTKDGTTSNGWIFSSDGTTNGDLRFLVWRPTRTDYQCNDVAAPLNQWACVGVGFKDSDTTEAVFYYGSLTSPMKAATSMLLSQNGSGAPGSDAAYNLWAGNNQRAPVYPFSGSQAVHRIYNKKLTLEEFRREQALGPRVSKHPNCVFDVWMDGLCVDRSKYRCAPTSKTGTSFAPSPNFGSSVYLSSRLTLRAASSVGPALAGSADATATASGEPSTAIAMAGGALQVATQAGVITTSIDISGSATLSAQMGGDPTFAISLNGAMLQQQLAQGALSGDPAIAGNATQQSSTTGEITVIIALAGAPIAQALASANLSAGGGLEGIAQQQSGMTGGILTNIDVAGTPQAFASGSGNLSSILSLVGVTLQVNNVTGQLNAAITVRADALQEALTVGDLTVRIAAVGSALQQAAMSGALDGVAGYAPPAARILRLPRENRVHRLPRENRILRIAA